MTKNQEQEIKHDNFVVLNTIIASPSRLGRIVESTHLSSERAQRAVQRLSRRGLTCFSGGKWQSTDLGTSFVANPENRPSEEKS